MTLWIHITRLILLLLLIPALAWGLMGNKCMERFNGLDGKPSPNYYWEVSGTVFIFLPSREEAESLIPDMEYLGYYKCRVGKAINFEVGLNPERYVLSCSWCQGEELE